MPKVTSTPPATPATLLQHKSTQAWIEQFSAEDKPTAVALIEAIKLVSRDEFAQQLRALIKRRIAAGSGPVGLYAERELGSRWGQPHRLFKETHRKHMRAYGAGPSPVASTKRYDPQVGSEGLVAQIITEICRELRGKVFSHPGPNTIRNHKIRRLFVVTDLLGSGQRAHKYLRAAWKVRSVRSWWSWGYIRFEVLTYAATPRGRRHVANHPSTPTVTSVTTCPTIRTAFSPTEAARVIRVCERYDPDKNAIGASLGYSDTGALIVFAHGAPNNTPRLLRKSTRHWAALFPERVTAEQAHTFDHGVTEARVTARLRAMRELRLAKSPWLNEAGPESLRLMLVLAATSHGQRSDESIAARTGLNEADVHVLVDRAKLLGWLNGVGRLTDLGQGQLAHARKGRSVNNWRSLFSDDKPHYYPRSLRAPKLKSSNVDR